MKKTNVKNKNQLKIAVNACEGADEDILIILNKKTEYLIFACGKGHSQIIKNINQYPNEVFSSSDFALKGFQL